MRTYVLPGIEITAASWCFPSTVNCQLRSCCTDFATEDLNSCLKLARHACCRGRKLYGHSHRPREFRHNAVPLRKSVDFHAFPVGVNRKRHQLKADWQRTSLSLRHAERITLERCWQGNMSLLPM